MIDWRVSQVTLGEPGVMLQDRLGQGMPDPLERRGI